MSKPGATWCACFCVFLLTAARLHAAGFSIYEASARGNALGGALVGSTGDASANYYNPANLTELPGVNSMVGVTLINPGGHIETPTGDTSLRSAAVMLNLLGDLWEQGEPDWSRLLAEPDVRLHLYGKDQPRKGRKMGHITVVGSTAEAALARATAIGALLDGARNAVIPITYHPVPDIA